MGDFDVDVVLAPLLGLELAPFHVALDGLFVVSEPAFEFVIGRHVAGLCAGMCKEDAANIERVATPFL